MVDNEKRLLRQRQKDRVRKRMRVEIDPENYVYTPAKKPIDFYDNDIHQRVGIYVRVSTDDVRQTTSYELQKKYYEDFVVRHPNWTLVEIYSDEGISGTSTKHRDGFNRMIADAKAGKLDIIITKNVSRFARNVMISIGVVRELAELRPPVGVFFESECIFSLNEDSQMALSFQATIAEEESHTRSRSMETSLRMRLDNGIPLTPKLLGYTHDADGNLVINPEEAPTVKLAFFMYLYGYSTQQIADTFTALERRTYLGNVKWTAGSIIQILRNERHCGDVLTRKTFTPNYHDHLSKKNRGERPQSRYLNHHAAIISRDDFIAVQRMLDNSKYGNKSILPELRVIDSGILKGFVIINPRWAAFKEADYLLAANSVYQAEGETERMSEAEDEIQIEVEAGEFDLRGFEVARPELFDSFHRPTITIADKSIKFSTACVRKFGSKNMIELLINPITRQLAIRPAEKKNRNAVCISKLSNGIYYPKPIPTTAFSDTLFSLFDWNVDCRYRIIGTLLERGEEQAYVFDVVNSEVFFKSYMVSQQKEEDRDLVDIQPLTQTRSSIRAVPKEWTTTFGRPFYFQEQSLAALENQSELDWKLRIEGQLVETGKKLHVTGFNELRSYIKQELRASVPLEVSNE